MSESSSVKTLRYAYWTSKGIEFDWASKRPRKSLFCAKKFMSAIRGRQRPTIRTTPRQTGASAPRELAGGFRIDTPDLPGMAFLSRSGWRKSQPAPGSGFSLGGRVVPSARVSVYLSLTGWLKPNRREIDGCKARSKEERNPQFLQLVFF